MKVDIYLVRDEDSTITNFRTSKAAINFVGNNSKYTIERVEVDLPKYKNSNTTLQVKSYQDIELDEQEPVTIDDVVKNHTVKVMNMNLGNKTKTASMLGITVKTLYNKLTEWGLY
jgi:DNA-binding protein Fis